MAPPKAKEQLGDKHLKVILGNEHPIEVRVNTMFSLAMYEQATAKQVFARIIELAKNSTPAQSAELQELKTLIEEIANGPQRVGTYVAKDTPLRVQVLLADGTFTILPVLDKNIMEECVCGDEVLIEASGKAVIKKYDSGTSSGEEAIFVRKVSDSPRWIEVATREGSEKAVYLASDKLIKKMDTGEVLAGSTLLVCTRRMLAMDCISPPAGQDKYMYVCREPVPDVIISRDIGNPPAFLFKMLRHVEREMKNPEIARAYRLNRSITRMLVGPSGTGKTLCLQGFIREVYELMSQMTGAPLSKLPDRMLRLRCSQVLSQWLGQSDKHLDRFFDEAELLSKEKFEWNGKEFDLPVIVVFEEAESLGRRRGGDADGVYDRIQTTILQRLDNTYEALRDNLIIYLFTSNLHSIMDPAFLRRAGGQVEHFDRLDEDGFCEVLRKQLRDRRISKSVDGKNDKQRLETLVDVVRTVLFTNDKPQVEVVFSNGVKEIKFMKDFLTGGLINRAVLQASEEACEREIDGDKRSGIDEELIVKAHVSQLDVLIGQLDLHCADAHIPVKQGVRIVNVRSLR